MRLFIFACLFLSFTTIQVRDESLKKPYFSTTRPGTWAKYESSWKQPKGMAGMVYHSQNILFSVDMTSIIRLSAY